MINKDFMSDMLKPYQPQLPIEELVVEVNKLYHSYEAENYDEAHSEIRLQLPPIWQEMIAQLLERTKDVKWNILDFGCGTGFEAEQLIRNLPQGSIAKLTCYDPSPEMLERCTKKISALFPSATFTSEFKTYPVREGQFNLIATNSLLHHLPDPFESINMLLPLLTFDAFWLA